ncbi:hypothetical protein CXF68_20340 [Tenacibaculum sp. Bg11-29]|uniref:hypothetical protein n=1 Tax=Tenacibaculum sp. Bg11-29 TaxID=2058306 RepID=UPI000C34A5A3|nr:hypothetical protein [Tenacibaculum sp. Bg11-29]PKH52904.1 hypothetical protein CXF68_20340 [Tenacibaculum sp. Bg11-29]
MNNKLEEVKKEIARIKNNNNLSKTTKYFHFVALNNKLDKLLDNQINTKEVFRDSIFHLN